MPHPVFQGAVNERRAALKMFFREAARGAFDSCKSCAARTIDVILNVETKSSVRFEGIELSAVRTQRHGVRF